VLRVHDELLAVAVRVIVLYSFATTVFSILCRRLLYILPPRRRRREELVVPS
jgi:hypothetical protein